MISKLSSYYTLCRLSILNCPKGGHSDRIFNLDFRPKVHYIFCTKILACYNQVTLLSPLSSLLFKGPLQSPFDVLLLSSSFLEVELSRTSSFRIPNRQNCAKRRTTRNFGLCWSFFEEKAYFCFAISHSLKQNKAPSVLHLSFGTWQEAPWYYKEHTAELLMKTLQ